MNATAKVEIAALAGALTLGILGDTLLRCFPWGLNFALWASLLAAAISFLGRAQQRAFLGGGWWLLLPIVLSPLAFLWHDSPQLKALNLLALLTALSLVMLRAQGGRLKESSLMQYVLGSLVSGLNTAFGIFPLLFGSSEWKKSLSGGSRSAAAVVRGVAFSLLPLLLFGSLLMAADAVFQNLVHRVLHFDITHLVVIAFITVWVAGYLRGFLFGGPLNLGPQKRLPISLGAIEIAVMLGLLDLLFLAFVAVEVRYFFGGSALVQASTGLTYAEYARRGFFELVAVAALVLPFLLLAHWLLRPDDKPAQRWFQWFAATQIVLLFVIMASAVERMRLYQEEYGLSEQRLYPTAFMGWLAVVFVWFCLTVLSGHRERFAFGAMVAGFLLVGALHALNPDALIARTNLRRSRSRHLFDAAYLAHLSADATPELVASLPDMKPADRRKLARTMLERWSRPENPDWRSWSLSRYQAWQAVSASTPALRAACAEPKH